jgi:hypothetical protein
LHAGDVPVPGDPWTEWRLRLMTSHGLEHPGVPHARFEDFPADEGWTRDGEVQRFDFARRLAPQELLDRIEQRSWSITWELGDAELAEVVAGLRADLLAHWGALDAPVDMPSSFWVRAYRPPERSGR